MTDAQYIDANYSLYGGPDESDIRCRTIRVVAVRKEQKCMCPAGSGHDIQIGQRAVADRALVDEEWGTCYTCLFCLEAWEKKGMAGIHPWCSVCVKRTTPDGRQS